MGQITVHFDREWQGKVVRMDYKWEYEGQEFLVEEIPCTKLPFDNDDYLDEHVSLTLEMVMYLQKNGEVSNKVSFLDIEDLLEDFNELLKEKNIKKEK